MTTAACSFGIVYECPDPATCFFVFRDDLTICPVCGYHSAEENGPDGCVDDQFRLYWAGPFDTEGEAIVWSVLSS